MKDLISEGYSGGLNLNHNSRREKLSKKCIGYPYLSKASSYLFRSVNTTYLLKASFKDATKKTNRRNRLSSERTNEYLQTAHKISPMSMTASWKICRHLRIQKVSYFSWFQDPSRYLITKKVLRGLFHK